jgi:hypothetical protein
VLQQSGAERGAESCWDRFQGLNHQRDRRLGLVNHTIEIGERRLHGGADGLQIGVGIARKLAALNTPCRVV